MTHPTSTGSTLLNTVAAAFVGVSMAACVVEDGDDLALDELEADEQLEPLPAEGEILDDDNEVVDAVEVAQQEVARIELDHGQVVFLVDIDGPAAGEVTMIETSQPDADGLLHPLPGDRSALDTFLSLTDPGVPVPQALLETSSDDVALDRASEREIVERLDAPTHASSDRLTIGTTPLWSAAVMCAQGTTSSMFLNEICPATNWDKDFCHNGTWHSVTDYSGGLYAHWSRSRTLACWANGRARHYYKFGGIWYKTRDEYIPSGNMHRYTKESTAALKRKITHSRTASGFVRGASHFENWY